MTDALNALATKLQRIGAKALSVFMQKKWDSCRNTSPLSVFVIPAYAGTTD